MYLLHALLHMYPLVMGLIHMTYLTSLYPYNHGGGFMYNCFTYVCTGL